MVVPEQLKELAYVPDAIRVKIIDPEAIFLLGILGESGRKLVEAGVEFYFEGSLAKKLIRKKIAVISTGITGYAIFDSVREMWLVDYPKVWWSLSYRMLVRFESKDKAQTAVQKLIKQFSSCPTREKIDLSIFRISGPDVDHLTIGRCVKRFRLKKN